VTAITEVLNKDVAMNVWLQREFPFVREEVANFCHKSTSNSSSIALKYSTKKHNVGYKQESLLVFFFSQS
jgi:hypothetical protein